MHFIERNPLVRCLPLAAISAGLMAVSAPESAARCAYVDVHFQRTDTPRLAPGPLTAGPGRHDGRMFTAKEVCFADDMSCHKRYGCFKTSLKLGPFIRRSGEPTKKRLLSRFGYIDPYGVHWDVPADIETDGATIPPGLKPIVGGSWTKGYIKAAVVHDFYIRKTTANPKKVHEMFLNALLASGVSPYWATMMYRGVRRFGPTWAVTALGENERIRRDNIAAQKKFDREFHERYQACLRRRTEQLRAGQRGSKCALSDSDELVFGLSEILLNDIVPNIKNIERDIREGRCVTLPDGMVDCQAIDNRERFNRR